jgi:hypothetical protein
VQCILGGVMIQITPHMRILVAYFPQVARPICA